MQHYRPAQSIPRDGQGDETGPQQLRVGAKGLITRQDRVLLIEERHSDGSAFWTLPGGGVVATESLSECLRREIAEEIRCPSTVCGVVNWFTYCHGSRPATTIYAVFDATLHSKPDPNTTEDVLEHAWRKPTDLPTTILDPVERVITASVTDGTGMKVSALQSCFKPI